MHLKGQVTGGRGEGRYFLSLTPYSQGFAKALGFRPFPGTLNVRLEDKDVQKIERLRANAQLIIPGFKMDGHDFHPIRACPARMKAEKGALVFPHLQHHPLSIVEFITAQDMRAKYRLKDDDWIEIEIDE